MWHKREIKKLKKIKNISTNSMH